MASLLVERDRQRLIARIEALTPEQPRRWGQMSVDRMLGHLVGSAQMALGDLAVAPRPGFAPLSRFPVKQLVLYVFPFPKSTPTAPELVIVEPRVFEAERARLLGLMARLVARGESGPAPVHSVFGPLSCREWGVLVHKHTDHHLKQFGG